MNPLSRTRLPVAPFMEQTWAVQARRELAADALERQEAVVEPEPAEPFALEVPATVPRRPGLWRRFVAWLRGGRRAAIRRHLEAVAIAESAPLLAAVSDALARLHDLEGFTVTRELLDDAARRLERTDPARAERLRAATDHRRYPDEAK